ncbi:coiled-coil domain-containing protein 195 [Tamandua tetradactyla]|uniref:coiled-coil domain-containing protein 195 n=1 Tax=Tamandua tetradactyla TaxID=48850 RepID=UPI004053CDE8
MWAEMDRLEKKNQVLQTSLTASSQRASGSGEESSDGRGKEAIDLDDLGKVPGQSPAVLQGCISTMSAPAEREHQGNVMIVRRYSISPSVHSHAANDPWKLGKRHPNSGILETHRTVQSLAHSSNKKQANEEKIFVADSFTNNCSSEGTSPGHDFGCRDKLKTVRFLIPRDMSPYSENSSSLKYSQNQTINQLSTITE